MNTLCISSQYLGTALIVTFQISMRAFCHLTIPFDRSCFCNRSILQVRLSLRTLACLLYRAMNDASQQNPPSQSAWYYPINPDKKFLPS